MYMLINAISYENETIDFKNGIHGLFAWCTIAVVALYNKAV